MELKSCIQAIIVVIYFILIVQFFRIVNFELDCDDTSDSACISFCSRDKETLPDSFIREHFHLNGTIFSFYDDFEIRRGKPKCLLTKKFVKQSVEVKDEDDFYTALDVSVEFYYFTPHQYCKEKVVGEDGAVKWDTYVCENSESFRLIFNGFVMGLSFIVLIFTLSVYLCFQQLRDFHGKCIMHFLLPLVVLYLFQPTLHYDEIISYSWSLSLQTILECTYVFIFLWISAMSFDMFWTFLRLHRNMPDIPNRLQIYMLFTYSSTVFTLAIYMLEIHSYTVFNDFLQFMHILIFMTKFIIGLDIVFFLAALYFKYQCMRNYDADNYAEYVKENEWFWLRFRIIAVLITTCVIEIRSLESGDVFEVFLIADFLKLLCSLSVFAIVVCGRDDVLVLLIEKYSAFKSRSGGIYFVNNLA